ncbi:MAG: 2-C-methyl-D-erythritol 4-phosphate cytidylyltransferase [Syntrophobacteraceae bacterium]|jgi:2-C-methyl-D-erythritol 4-phosphate cytidylyltransferase|nr:2-C-methyl-D-erythritol 4-phosphate cytidylyltransferase [Syntrophobacteraceae bacterium]
MMNRFYAIIPAAGRGVRMGSGLPKQFLEMEGRPILVRTLTIFCRLESCAGILLVLPAPFQEGARQLLERFMGLEPAEGMGVPVSSDGTPWFQVECPRGAGPDRSAARTLIRLVAGGGERQDSVLNALLQLPEDAQWVMIHDGVRPFASLDLMRRTLELAVSTGAAIAAIPSTDTVKRVVDDQVVETLPREAVWLVQTPQVFRRDLVLRAYHEARRQGWLGTDDASFVERLGHPVAVAQGERSNIKVTTPEDLEWGETFLKRGRAAP